jgi:acetyl esterase/lipase
MWNGLISKRGAARAAAVEALPLVPLLLGPLLLVFLLSSPPARSAEHFERYSDINYDLGSPPADPTRNLLDIYLPVGPPPEPVPFVLFVHGGGWMKGDKANRATLNKARLFTGLGYGLVSMNYRLSPAVTGNDRPSPGRISFPDHPDDIGEGIGWLDRNAAGYGLDPARIVLMGHSAGAQIASLVGTDGRFVRRYGVDPGQILGVISLDSPVFDIREAIAGRRSGGPPPVYTNAFGTPVENAATNSWRRASPLVRAGRSDPRHLFIVEREPWMIRRQLEMARKLGQTADTVLPVPLGHAGLSQAVGSPADSTLTTPAVTEFLAERFDGARKPTVTVTARPSRTLRLTRHPRTGRAEKRPVRFGFSGSGNFAGFQCRLGRAAYRPCRSPRRYMVGPGRQSFKVRPVYPSGRPGEARTVTFVAKAGPRPRARR